MPPILNHAELKKVPFRRQATCYSVISSIVSMKTAGYQFMVFAGDGLNSSPGVQLHQGVDNHVPIPVGRCGLDLVFCLQHDSDFKLSIPITLVTVVVRSFSCDATCAPPSVASRRQVRSSSFLDFAKPIAGRSAPRDHREQCAPSWLDITPCAIAGVPVG